MVHCPEVGSVLVPVMGVGRYMNSCVGVDYFYLFTITNGREIRSLYVSDFKCMLVRRIPQTQKSINYN